MAVCVKGGRKRKKRTMVSELRRIHAKHTKSSGAELISMELRRFVAPRTVEIRACRGFGGTRKHSGRTPSFSTAVRAAAIPEVTSLAEATQLTNCEAAGSSIAARAVDTCSAAGTSASNYRRAFRRFGSNCYRDFFYRFFRKHGAQLAKPEDPDVCVAASAKGLVRR